MSTPSAEKNVPKHIAIIMDGNGRWAKACGKSRFEGHKQGAAQIEKVLDAAKELGVEYITLYAFSSENWNRPAAEVAALMRLLEYSIKTNEKKFVENGVRFATIGDISALPDYCQKAVAEIKEATKNCKNQTLVLALNYGSRGEVARAAQKLVEDALAGKISAEAVSWDEVEKRLDTAAEGIPDPDLIIRTSGEQRLSNYLMLQGAYAELYFTNVNWPDFGGRELAQAVAEFANRERRYGLTSEQIQQNGQENF